MKEKKYGLMTSIAMIAGIVIGSGIFFKSDDVLRYTNGNMFLGILVFSVAAIAIIFGSLSIAQLAARSDRPGGIIGYFETFVHRKVATSVGWFQLFLYFGPLIGVISWVSGLYLCQLFGWEATIEKSSFIGCVILMLLFAVNAISAAAGGAFQNASMIIKLVPLVLLGIAGLLFGDVSEIANNDFTTLKETIRYSSWTAAFAPIAFSYDGWSVATTVCHKIKNSKKNLPIAMIIAPMVVLCCYLFYFIGVTSLVGVDTVMEQGNDSVYTAANYLFGPIGAKLVLVFVVISVLGTLNGLILAFIQLPYALALNRMIPKPELFLKKSKHFGHMPIYSALTALVISMLWAVINYITQSHQMVGDVSEVPVCLSYFLYLILYITVMKLRRKGEIKSNLSGYMIPGLACIGSLIIFGGTITHPSFLFFVVIAMIVTGSGYYYGKKVIE